MQNESQRGSQRSTAHKKGLTAPLDLKIVYQIFVILFNQHIHYESLRLNSQESMSLSV